MILFSSTPCRSDNAWDYAEFDRAAASDLSALASIITRDVWSPCVWINNKRAKRNFIYADVVALDFDDGRWTLDTAREWLKFRGFAGIIGTTKSHQKPKGNKPAVDRFRVVMPFSRRVTDRNHFEWTIVDLQRRKIPLDRACKDAGRFFWPCTGIVDIINGMGIVPIEVAPMEIVDPSVAAYRDMGQMPPALFRRIKAGAPEGQRNTFAFWAACRCRELRMPDDETIALLAQHIPLPMAELTRTVKQAYKY